MRIILPSITKFVSTSWRRGNKYIHSLRADLLSLLNLQARLCLICCQHLLSNITINKNITAFGNNGNVNCFSRVLNTIRLVFGSLFGLSKINLHSFLSAVLVINNITMFYIGYFFHVVYIKLVKVFLSPIWIPSVSLMFFFMLLYNLFSHWIGRFSH